MIYHIEKYYILLIFYSIGACKGINLRFDLLFFREKSAKPFVSRKLGHITKLIQSLEERHLANIVLPSNNATDAPECQMISTHH